MNTIRAIRSAPDRCGFSLIEVVIVIALIGVAAAIAMPRYANSTSLYRADLAARRIVAELTMAQHRARVSGVQRTLTFVPKLSISVIVFVSENGAKTIESSVDYSHTPFHASFASIDLGGDESIVFNGHGVPDSGGSIIISSGNAQRTLTIDAESGSVSLQ